MESGTWRKIPSVWTGGKAYFYRKDDLCVSWARTSQKWMLERQNTDPVTYFAGWQMVTLGLFPAANAAMRFADGL